MARKAKSKKEEVIIDQPAPKEDVAAPAEASFAASTEPTFAKSSGVAEEHNIFNADGELVVDVFETPADFVVLATIAGVNIKDLDISVEKEMMVIKGNRHNPHHDSENKYFYQECYFGPFSRKIVLPENIHTDQASAEMDKGMLTIKIPKKTDHHAKTEVKTS